jgi:hypothetical protein
MAAKNYGVVERVPSVAGLKRRIEFLGSQSGAATNYGSEINSAKVLLQKAIGNITTLSPDIAERNSAIEKAWKILDNVAEKSGTALKEQADYLAQRGGQISNASMVRRTHASSILVDVKLQLSLCLTQISSAKHFVADSRTKILENLTWWENFALAPRWACSPRGSNWRC